MKTKLIIVIPFLCLLLMSFKPVQSNNFILYSSPQDLTIIGIYDGNEGYGYNFITKHKDDGSDFTMTFQKVDESVMKEYDLDEELFLNQQFEITYNLKTVVTKDGDGFDEENEIYTITKLKAL